mmetsp:Transcript_18204/g.42577  ORF Transcript_18204/g.42577 Transcript_18204/m.42577 type:complete len:916 (+) Transcript_18204:108-2855(+)
MGGRLGSSKQQVAYPAPVHHAPADLRPVDGGEKAIIFDYGLQTTVDVNIRLEGLKRAYPTFVVAYTRSVHDANWVELGKTEVAPESRHPVFSKTFSIDFRIEERRELRFEVYRMRDQIELSDLNAQAFLGCVTARVAELYLAKRGVPNKGWCVKDMEHPRPPCHGKVWMYAEESYLTKNIVSFRLTAKELQSVAWATLRLNPYCIFYRVVHAGGEELYIPIYRTEVCRNTSTPKWERVEMPVQAMFINEDSAKMLIEVYSWNRMGEDERIGMSTLSFKDAQGAFKTSGKFQMSLIKDKVGPTTGSAMSMPSLPSISTKHISQNTINGAASQKVGKLSFEDAGMIRRYSFLDFVRGGLDLNILFGIDFTRSNVNPNDPNSLHRIKGDGQNEYATAMRTIAGTLADFDPAKEFAAYGFGAKLPPSLTICSDCFSIVGDWFDPKVLGVEAVMKAYERCLHVVHLHGPTRFASLVRTAIQYADCYKEATDDLKTFRTQMKYTVLVVFADGEFKDSKETLAELAKASHYPLSVIVVGMGDVDIPAMPEMQEDVNSVHRLQKTDLPTVPRRVVTYVPYKDNKSDAALSKAMLKNLPADILAYYEAVNTKPRKLDSYEDTAGSTIPKQIVDLEAREKTEKQRTATEARERDASGSRNGTLSNPGTKEAVGNNRTWSGTKSSSVVQSSSTGGERTLSSLPQSGEGTTHTKDSAADEFIRKKREMERHLASLPNFLKDEREELVRKAAKHGYPKHAVERALKEGVPTATFDVLIDNLTHCRNGTAIPMKEAAMQAHVHSKRVHSHTLTTSKASRRRSNSNTRIPTKTSGDAPVMIRSSSQRSHDSKVSGQSQLAIGDSSAPGICRVCLERPVNTEFVPCGHRLACSVCADKLGPVCVLCKGTITLVKRLQVARPDKTTQELATK